MKKSPTPDLFFILNGTYIKCNNFKSIKDNLPLSKEILFSVQNNKEIADISNWNLICLSLKTDNWDQLCIELKSKYPKFNPDQELIANYLLRDKQFPVLKIMKEEKDNQ